jgi:hypothetical protein
MSSANDIYNPPPAPVPLVPRRPEPIRWTLGDFVALAVLGIPVYVAAAWAWSIEPTLGLWVTVAGVFMISESWLSAVAFIHRHPAAAHLGQGRRWPIFFVAMLPWLITLACGVTLMLGLFYLSDATRS